MVDKTEWRITISIVTLDNIKLNGNQSGELQCQLSLDKIKLNGNKYGELQYQL